MTIANDSTVAASGAGGTTTGITVAFNNVAGSFIWVTLEAGAAGGGSIPAGFVTGQTYAGNNMTPVGNKAATSTTSRLFSFVLPAAPTGNNNLVFTWASQNMTTVIVHAVSYSGNGINYRNFNSTSSDSAANSPTLTITTAIGSIVVVSGDHGDSITGILSAWGTQRQNTTVDNFTSGDNLITGDVVASGLTVVAGFTSSVTDAWALLGAELYESGGGAPGSNVAAIPFDGPGSMGATAWQWQPVIGVDPSTAATDWTQTPLDLIGITDVVDVSVGYGLNPVDLVGIVDSVLFDQTKGVTDLIGITDSITFDQTKDITDLVGIVDSVAFAQEKGIVDPIGITDSVQLDLSHVVSPIDLIGITDAISLVWDRGQAQVDLVGILDSITQTWDRVQTQVDLVGILDSVVVARDIQLSFTDLVGILTLRRRSRPNSSQLLISSGLLTASHLDSGPIPLILSGSPTLRRLHMTFSCRSRISLASSILRLPHVESSSLPLISLASLTPRQR